MPYPTQIVQIPVGKALDQSKGDKGLQPPNLLLANDIGLPREGKIEKRPGKRVLNTTGLPSGVAPSSLVTNRGALGMITQDGVYVYNKDLDSWALRNTAGVRSIDVSVSKLAVAKGTAKNSDAARIDDTVMVVFEDSGTIYALWISEAGVVQMGPTAVSSHHTHRPRVIAVGGSFLVFGEDADGHLHVSTSSPSAGTFVYRRDLGAVTSWDVHTQSNTVCYLAEYTGATGLLLMLSGSDGATLDSVTLGSSPTTAVYHDVVAHKVYVGVSASVGERLQRYDDDVFGLPDWNTIWLSTDNTPAVFGTARTFLLPLSETTMGIFCSTGSFDTTINTSSRGIVVGEVDTTTGTALAASTFYDHCLFSRGVYVPGLGPVFATYLPFLTEYPSALFCTIGADRAGNKQLEVLSRFADNVPNEAADSFDFQDLDAMSTLLPMTDGRYLTTFTRVLADIVMAADSFHASRIDLATLDVAAKSLGSALASAGTLIAGGVLGFYDRFQSVENTPLLPPFILKIVKDNPTACTMDTTVTNPAVDVTLVARWTDANGRVHRSAPSNTFTLGIVEGVGQEGYCTLDFTIDFVPAVSGIQGDNLNEMAYEVYASQGYQYDGSITSFKPQGGNRYLVAVLDPPFDRTTDGDHPYVTVHGTATWPTSGQGTGQVEYVQTGERSADPSEAARSVVASPTRAFFLSADGSYVGYSKPYSPGFGVEFNVAQRLPIPGESGEALALLDDKLIVLQRTGLLVTSVSGGPGADGAGGNFPPLRPIPTDSGCTNRKSVVTTPVGVLFQGARGIYLVDRTLRVSFVGGAVQDEVTDSVLCAAVSPATSEVFFAISNEEAVVFNYAAQTWYKHTALPNTAFLYHEGALHTLHSSGHVYYYTSDTYGDVRTSAGTSTPTIETSWLHLAGMAGYERIRAIRLIGAHDSGHLLVSLYYDYEDTASETFLYEEDALGVTDELVLRIKPARRRCSALKIRIEEQQVVADKTSIGKGWTLEGIQLEIAANPATTLKVADPPLTIS